MVHHSQIFKGNIVCRICEAETRKQLASENGLTELYEIGNRYFNYILPCGHEKVLRVDHAIDGSFSCDQCGDSYYQRPSNIYLFEFNYQGFSWLKFGFSSNINLRKANYGLPKGVLSELIIQAPFDKGRDAMLKEKAIHRKMRKYRLDKNFMKEYHVNNGFSECYDILAKLKFIALIKEVTSD